MDNMQKERFDLRRFCQLLIVRCVPITMGMTIQKRLLFEK